MKPYHYKLEKNINMNINLNEHQKFTKKKKTLSKNSWLSSFLRFQKSEILETP